MIKNGTKLMYTVKDYGGEELSVTPEQAAKIAGVAELIEIEIRGQKHYLSPKSVASITPYSEQWTHDDGVYQDENVLSADSRSEQERYAAARKKSQEVRDILAKKMEMKK